MNGRLQYVKRPLSYLNYRFRERRAQCVAGYLDSSILSSSNLYPKEFLKLGEVVRPLQLFLRPLMRTRSPSA